MSLALYRFQPSLRCWMELRLNLEEAQYCQGKAAPRASLKDVGLNSYTLRPLGIRPERRCKGQAQGRRARAVNCRNTSLLSFRSNIHPTILFVCSSVGHDGLAVCARIYLPLPKKYALYFWSSSDYQNSSRNIACKPWLIIKT